MSDNNPMVLMDVRKRLVLASAHYEVNTNGKATDKHYRVDEANRIIQFIGDHGRRFLHRDGVYGTFYYHEDGRLRYIDEFTNRNISVWNKFWRHGFSHGGTLRGIIDALTAWIIHGTPVPFPYGVHWPRHTGRKTTSWGYSTSEAHKMTSKIRASDAVNTNYEI